MAGKLPGKLLSVTAQGRKLRCQTNGTLTLGSSTTQDEPCKPDDVSPGTVQGEWETSTVNTRNWKISVDAAAFLDDLRLNELDLIEIFVNGDLEVEVEWLTTPGDHDFPEDVVFSGSALMDSLTFNAPAAGNANYSVSFTGNGAPSYTRIPVVT